MVHVFRLGPLEIQGQDSFVYAGFSERGPLHPEIAPSDVQGLRALAAAAKGRQLLCEPSLAKAGKPLGFEPAPLPEPALLVRATLAYGLALGPTSGPPDPEMVLGFLAACASFWEARPWDLIDSDDPVPVTLTLGGRSRVCEASVLGGGGQEFGLALYDKPGTIRKITRLVDQGRMEESQRFAALAVTFHAEPSWAAAAIEDAFGMARLPIPQRVKGARIALAQGEDLVVAAAAIEAVAQLARTDEDESEATVRAGGISVTARVCFPVVDESDGDLFEPERAMPASAVASRAKTPRNAPCPCGSGCKYKKCHLAEDEEAAAARGRALPFEAPEETARRLTERDPVHELDERITSEALAIAKKRWGHDFDPGRILGERQLGPEDLAHAIPWIVGHCPGPGGRTALELLLDERGDRLDAEARTWIESQKGAYFSFHDILSTNPGRSMELRDLLSGSESVVHETSASRTVPVRSVMMARVVKHGDRAFLVGCHSNVLPPRAGAAAVLKLRSALRVRAARVPTEKLRKATGDGTVLRIWQEAIDELQAQPFPHLQNTDGEDLLLTVDRFDIVEGAGHAGAVQAEIHMLPGAGEPDEDSDGAISVSFTKEGNARTAMLPTTLIGTARIDGAVLKLESNSVERADRLRRLVEDRLGSLVSFRIREHADPVAQLGSGPPSKPTEPPPPEFAALLRKLQAEHYERWPDESIPALGGLTPRDAAGRKGQPRRQLELILAEIENGESTRPKAERFDVAALRRKLGLE